MTRAQGHPDMVVTGVKTVNEGDGTLYLSRNLVLGDLFFWRGSRGSPPASEQGVAKAANPVRQLAGRLVAALETTVQNRNVCAVSAQTCCRPQAGPVDPTHAHARRYSQGQMSLLRRRQIPERVAVIVSPEEVDAWEEPRQSVALRDVPRPARASKAVGRQRPISPAADEAPRETAVDAHPAASREDFVSEAVAEDLSQEEEESQAEAEPTVTEVEPAVAEVASTPVAPVEDAPTSIPAAAASPEADETEAKPEAEQQIEAQPVVAEVASTPVVSVEKAPTPAAAEADEIQAQQVVEAGIDVPAEADADQEGEAEPSQRVEAQPKTTDTSLVAALVFALNAAAAEAERRRTSQSPGAEAAPVEAAPRQYQETHVEAPQQASEANAPAPVVTAPGAVSANEPQIEQRSTATTGPAVAPHEEQHAPDRDPTAEPELLLHPEAACDITVWRGYRKAKFYARVVAAHGEEFAVAESEAFRWRGNGTLEQTEDAVAAHNQLLDYLESHGWKVRAEAPIWYAKTLTRP
jgi:hypothetical protein